MPMGTVASGRKLCTYSGGTAQDFHLLPSSCNYLATLATYLSQKTTDLIILKYRAKALSLSKIIIYIGCNVKKNRQSQSCGEDFHVPILFGGDIAAAVVLTGNRSNTA